MFWHLPIDQARHRPRPDGMAAAVVRVGLRQHLEDAVLADGTLRHDPVAGQGATGGAIRQRAGLAERRAAGCGRRAGGLGSRHPNVVQVAAPTARWRQAVQPPRGLEQHEVVGRPSHAGHHVDDVSISLVHCHLTLARVCLLLAAGAGVGLGAVPQPLTALLKAANEDRRLQRLGQQRVGRGGSPCREWTGAWCRAPPPPAVEAPTPWRAGRSAHCRRTGSQGSRWSGRAAARPPAAASGRGALA